MKTIEISDIGRVEKLSIPLPQDGGVVVLKGRNGAGKTTALESVSSLLAGKGTPSVTARDGRAKGVVSGWDAKLTISRRSTRTGEAQVESLEGRFDISDLVDPGIDNPEAADSTRIKALLSLSGVKICAADFAEAVGGESLLDKTIDPDAKRETDPVRLAGKIKRSFEAAARKEEEQAERYRQEEQKFASMVASVGKIADLDQGKCQSALESAILNLEQLRSRRKQAMESAQHVMDAKGRKIAAVASYAGPSASEAEAELSACRSMYEHAQRIVADLTEKLAEARQVSAAASGSVAAAIAAHKAASAHESLLSELDSVIQSDAVQDVPGDEMKSAESAVDAARADVAAALQANQAAVWACEAARHNEAATERGKAAESLRKAAKATDSVLSDAVGKVTSPLFVEDGRLVTETDRGTVQYAALSDGERWKIALDIAIEAVGKSGVLVLDQNAWESLDPINRRAIESHLKGTGVVLLTAESDETETVSAVVGV